MSQCGHTGRGPIDKASCQGTDCQKCCHSSCYAWGKLSGRGQVARHKVLKLPCMGQVSRHKASCHASCYAWGMFPGRRHVARHKVSCHAWGKLPGRGQVAMHGASCQARHGCPLCQCATPPALAHTSSYAHNLAAECRNL